MTRRVGGGQATLSPVDASLMSYADRPVPGQSKESVLSAFHSPPVTL